MYERRQKMKMWFISFIKCKIYNVRISEPFQDLCRNDWAKFKIIYFQILKEARF